MTRRTLIWTSAALLGIVLTAALAWSASQLAGQRIGLSSEPLSALGRLAPPPSAGHTAPAGSPPRPLIRPRTTTTPASGTGASNRAGFNYSPASGRSVRCATCIALSGTAGVQPRGAAGRDRSGHQLRHPAVTAVTRAGSEPPG